MLLQRKVAQIIFGSQGGKPNDFNEFWPLPESIKIESSVKTWGTKEEADLLRRQIEKAHGIKLSHE